MGDILQRALHHPDDGAFLCLHGADLQRLLLQVSQHIWLRLERQSDVHTPAVDVSYLHTHMPVSHCTQSLFIK